MQGLVSEKVFFLIFIFGFCSVVRGLLGGEFALQSDFIHFGDELSFGYDGVVVGIQFVDDTRYLCPDFDLCDRLDCPGCRDGFRDISPYSLSRFDNIVRALRLPAETEPEYGDGDNGRYGSDDDFF